MPEGEERTELPSEYKQQKAREEGNVKKSQEVIGFLALLVGFPLIFYLLPISAERLKTLFLFVMDFRADFTQSGMQNLAFVVISNALLIVAPIFLALLLIGVIGNVAQFGFLLTIKTIIPKFSKINAINGLKNLFSMKKLVDGALITLKVAIALCLGFFIFMLFLKELGGVAFFNIYAQLLWLKDKAFILAGALLALFFLMSILDYFVKRKQYIDNLKMTKQEVKEEFKMLQGNPQIRARVRAAQRKMASQRMLANVASANVVITNPTHYAVAVKFSLEDSYFMVVAKGTDLLAIRIKEIAREHNIPIRENKELARSLYKSVEVDAIIPLNLARAVLTVLMSIEKYNREITEFFRNHNRQN